MKITVFALRVTVFLSHMSFYCACTEVNKTVTSQITLFNPGIKPTEVQINYTRLTNRLKERQNIGIFIYYKYAVKHYYCSYEEN